MNSMFQYNILKRLVLESTSICPSVLTISFHIVLLLAVGSQMANNVASFRPLSVGTIFFFPLIWSNEDKAIQNKKSPCNIWEKFANQNMSKNEVKLWDKNTTIKFVQAYNQCTCMQIESAQYTQIMCTNDFFFFFFISLPIHSLVAY